GRRAHVSQALRGLAVDAGLVERALDEADIAEDDREQIVEVMSDARGELADRLEPLHLSQRRLDALSLLDLGQELAVGGGELTGAVLDADLELFVEAPAFVLTPAAAQRCLHHADEGGRMERPLKEAGIAERRIQLGGLRIPFDAAAVLGQHDEREVRPWRLRANPAGEGPRIAAQRLLRDDGEIGAAPQLQQQVLQVAAHDGRYPRVVQDVACDQRVAAARRENQRTLERKGCRPVQDRSMRASERPTKVGTPRRTPWNSCSASPRCMPVPLIRNSRIVSSCAPPRFLMTDIARRTRPSASK